MRNKITLSVCRFFQLHVSGVFVCQCTKKKLQLQFYIPSVAMHQLISIQTFASKQINRISVACLMCDIQSLIRASNKVMRLFHLVGIGQNRLHLTAIKLIFACDAFFFIRLCTLKVVCKAKIN